MHASPFQTRSKGGNTVNNASIQMLSARDISFRRAIPCWKFKREALLNQRRWQY